MAYNLLRHIEKFVQNCMSQDLLSSIQPAGRKDGHKYIRNMYRPVILLGR